MTNSHLMANSATLDLIKPSQVTRISAWSSETEDIIAAAVSVLINN